MSTNYSVGDDIVVTDDTRCDITMGKVYQVVEVSVSCVTIIDDSNDRHAIKFDDVELASTPYQGAMGAANRQAVRAHTFKAQYQHDPAEVQAADEDDYDTRKANRSVTSGGLFKKGDKLVYCDGTPTNEQRTVTRCTATCVWFEETYSMPFNPDEFQLEGSDY